MYVTNYRSKQELNFLQVTGNFFTSPTKDKVKNRVKHGIFAHKTTESMEVITINTGHFAEVVVNIKLSMQVNLDSVNIW